MSNMMMFDPQLIISGIGATLQAIQTWLQFSNFLITYWNTSN